MEITERHNFTRFPYSYEVRENGDINNGGFDLIQSPEKINDIHEIAEFPWFKDFISAVNGKNGVFMTLGCTIGLDNESLFGYVDFSARPGTSGEIKEYLVNLDVHFYEYLSQAIPEEEIQQQAIQYAQQTLLWLASPFEIYGESYSKVNLTFGARQQDGLKWAFEHLSYFLTEYFPSKLIPKK
ncbi:hypothetical protein EDF88_4170 [Buttiauxella sp. BIGb0552]|uniref:hypothetical protein n=1 Tax=Buttiauxella sp. BIGb0552 TaxID=2485120 RepID=UPI001064C8A5|nr:hypothetical protein [Buttiauxella sp. BIGb0552]TDX14843.1 hypothetical protein EDF88_4170 [Buttiauxella sp. BIGb0552]